MKHPKRSEVWKTDKGIDYVFVLIVGKHSTTARQYVMYQSLSYDERMALLAGAKILSVKLRSVRAVERELFEETYNFLMLELPYRGNLSRRRYHIYTKKF